MRSSIIAICVVLLLAFAVCPSAATAQHDATTKVRDAIQANFLVMAKAMQEGDAATIAHHFTEDALFKLPGQPPVKGRDGIRKVHEAMMEQGLNIRPKTAEVQLFGDHAVELGTVDILGPDGKVANKAYYLTLWKKIDGEWKIYRDMVSAMPSGPDH